MSEQKKQQPDFSVIVKPEFCAPISDGGYGLAGYSLLIFAMIYGCSQSGIGTFHATRDWLADFFHIDKSNVTRVIRKLLADDLICEVGNYKHGQKKCREYVVNPSFVPGHYPAEESLRCQNDTCQNDT